MRSAEGNRASNTLTGTDGLYNGRAFSRQRQRPVFAIGMAWAAPRDSAPFRGKSIAAVLAKDSTVNEFLLIR